MIEKRIVKEFGLLNKYKSIIEKAETIRSLGRVSRVTGKVVLSSGPEVRLGELCHIERIENESYILSEVIGFHENMVVLSPLEDITGIFPGCRVLSTGSPARINVSDNLLGRVIDGIGKPIDQKPPILGGEYRTLVSKPPNPMQRPLIDTPLETGIKAIDSFLTLGQGQRVGIFAGSGVGKSTLLGMIARYSKADVNVIGLIGERGREVGEFITHELGENGLKRSVVVVASSNESAMHRVRAAYLVTTIAEYFRDQGKNVMLMMDSLTRLAMAQREVGLAAGEPATTRGYPPSVFGMLPELLERAGKSEEGTITGVYTVLVEADDMNEPIADATRGILDGHIVLSRELAHRSHYPSIEITESISRSMNNIVDKNQQQAAAALRGLLSAYKENEDMIKFGGYVKGSDATIDNAINLKEPLNDFLKQSRDSYARIENTQAQLQQLHQQIRSRSRTVQMRRAG